jgi:NTE family protein
VEALNTPNGDRRKRPSIGLALGGGAARGFAHIGVLQTLLAHGVKPDVITGTSMGAVVGGCYAAGQMKSLCEWTLTLTRRRVFRYVDFSIAGSGLMGGMRLARHLRGTLGRTKTRHSRRVLLRLQLKSTQGTKFGSLVAGWWRRCGPPIRCRACLPRCK